MNAAAADQRPLWPGHDRRRQELAGCGPGWLRELRKRGLTRFAQVGFPTTRLEEWKATNVSPIAKTDFAPADRSKTHADPELPPVAGLDFGGPRLVFVDGSFADGLSSPRTEANGVWVGPLARAVESIPERLKPHLTRRDPTASAAFDALNSAFLEDGAVVLVEPGTDAGPPIHLVYLSTGADRPTATHLRTVIAAGRESRVSIVETYVGTDDAEGYLTNAVSEISADDQSHVDHYRIQAESPSAFHISTLNSRQTRDSRCSMHNINFGGRLVRHDIVSVLDGEGAYCRLNGLNLTRDRQHVDNHTVLDHAKPHGDSRELYKGILQGNSRTVFNGRIVVRQGAQKTDAKQSNRNLLLSRGALAHARPQLEIYADDVRCTHGATIGRLDENAVFYLRSRGLTDAEARNLLVGAFAGEVLELIEIEALRSHLERTVTDRLRRAAE
jgi:Fe-S cluster assembly protein SufD